MIPYVVQASPLSKIFCREWEEKCLEDPSIIAKSEPGLFKVSIKRPSGGIVLHHMKPVHASTLIPRLQTLPDGGQSKTRDVDDDEVSPLVQWLAGVDGRYCEDTDIYGVVAIDVGNQFESALQELMHLTMETAADGTKKDSVLKKQAAVQKAIIVDMDEKLKLARKQADERVKRALAITHNNLLKSWEALKSDGKGTYAPSSQEALGYFVMKAEIDRRLELNRKLYNDVAAGIPGAARQ